MTASRGTDLSGPTTDDIRRLIERLEALRPELPEEESDVLDVVIAHASGLSPEHITRHQDHAHLKAELSDLLGEALGRIRRTRGPWEME